MPPIWAKPCAVRPIRRAASPRGLISVGTMHKVYALVGQLALPLVASMAAVLSVASAGCGGASASAEGAASSGGGNHPLVGQKAPDFTVAALNQKGSVTLSKYAGKVAIVDFWATWCEPCKKSFPKLQDLYVKYKASGLEMVAISEDDENNGIKDFAETYGAKFPVGWDDGKTIAGKWQIPNMPSTFIVDKTGIVRFVHLGYRDGEEQEIEKEVKSLL
jgi:cytochrome c biogenesis protein CcmG/thiol:disulfide interchange protein DsbE